MVNKKVPGVIDVKLLFIFYYRRWIAIFLLVATFAWVARAEDATRLL